MNKRQRKKQMKYKSIDVFIRKAYLREAEMIESWLEDSAYEPTAEERDELYHKIMERMPLNSD